MKATQKATKAFFQNTGKLFYAIAAADGKVKTEEFNKLQEIVKNEWLTTNIIIRDYNEDIESLILDTFKWLQSIDDYNADVCYTSFIDFKKTHEQLFTKKIKQLILKTAGQIAASFSGVNKSELIMLAKLNLEFKKQVDEK